MRELEKILKVNYLSDWDKNGTHYNQNIKITFQLAKGFNWYVNKIKEEIEKKSKKTHITSGVDMEILTYLQKLDLKEKNYLTLTTLNYFMTYYIKYVYQAPKRDKNYERILHRNTIISIV